MYPSYRQSQSGMALIVVLLVLLLITIIGVIAVRQSFTDLDVSTASQVNKVLFQAGNNALMKIEKQDRMDSNTVDANATLRGKMVGVPEGEQIVFCLRPQQNSLFEISQFTQRLSSASGSSGITYNGIAGFCNAKDPDDYISPNRVLTQVYMVNEPKDEEIETFSGEARLTASDDFAATGKGVAGFVTANRFTTYTVSVLPAFTDAPEGDKDSDKDKTVSGCLKQQVNNGDVDNCLRNLNVPYHIQIQEYESTSTGFPSV